MRFLIILTLLVLAISYGTYYLIEEPGYVFLQWGQWQIEMSLTLIVGVLIFFSLASYLAYSFIVGVLRIPGKMKNAYRIRRMRQNQKRSVKGYTHLVQGDWEKAEKHLLTTARRTEEPVINYLAAAYSAQQRGDIARRDKLLQRAGKGSIGSNTLIELVRSKLQIDEGRTEDAIKNLHRVRTTIPGSKAMLRLLTEAYILDNRWDDVFDLIPSLRKHRAFSSKEMESLYNRACRNKFAASETAAKLLSTWKKIPAASQRVPELTAAYAKRLLDFERYLEAEKVLRRALNSTWDSELAYLYGFVGGSVDSRQTYQRAASWLSSHSDDADLLLTCGKLAIRNEQWTKAREHLGLCIERGGREEASVELAKIFEDQGDFQGAFDAYKRGAVQLANQRALVKL